MRNTDRTIFLDLSAVEEARGPQPNDYFVCLTRKEASVAALSVALVLAEHPCTERECEACNAGRRLFWDLTNELGPRYQQTLFLTLAEIGCATPGTPWEEVGA